MVGSGSGASDRSKEAVGMMALHEALRTVCLNSDWTYSVFWTIRPRPYIFLTLSLYVCVFLCKFISCFQSQSLSMVELFPELGIVHFVAEELEAVMAARLETTTAACECSMYKQCIHLTVCITSNKLFNFHSISFYYHIFHQLFLLLSHPRDLCWMSRLCKCLQIIFLILGNVWFMVIIL